MSTKIDRTDERPLDYHSDIGRYKAKPLSDSTLITMREDSWNWEMLKRISVEMCLYCNGKFAFQIAKRSSLIPRIDPPSATNKNSYRKNKQLLEALFARRTHKAVAMSVIGARFGMDAHIYYALSSSQRPNARLSFVDALYYATIMKRFPGAVPFWFPRLKSEYNSSALRFIRGGKVVAILMGLRDETLKNPRDVIRVQEGVAA